jgi:hypothetical protein
MTPDLEWIKCDSCSAQALFIARSTSGELYFCGHHKRKFAEGLDKWAYEIIECNKKEEVPLLQTEEV